METEAGAGQLVDLRDLLAACVAACELGCLEVPPSILSILVTGRDDDDDCDVAGAAMGEAAPCQGGGGDQGPAEGS